MGTVMKDSKTTSAIENESFDDHLVRTSLEAEAEAEKNGWVNNEEAEALMTAHKHAFFKKQKKAA